MFFPFLKFSIVSLNLLLDDAACIDASQNLIKVLDNRGTKYLELVSDLSKSFWKDRALRLEQLSSTESQLAAILRGSNQDFPKLIPFM